MSLVIAQFQKRLFSVRVKAEVFDRHVDFRSQTASQSKGVSIHVVTTCMQVFSPCRH